MKQETHTRVILASLLIFVIGAVPTGAATKWARVIGGPGAQDAESVCPTADGGYACVGYTLVGASSFDVLVFKLDASGNTVWQKTYSGPTHDWDALIIQTSDGGYLCSASTLSFGAGGWDAWILRLDPVGNVIWQKTCGLAGNDQINSVLQAADGGFFFVGWTDGRVPGWGTDLWVGKLSPTGDLTWEKRWGGPAEDIGLCGDQVYGGDFLVSGYTKSFGAGGSDGWVLRLTQGGNLVWQKTYGGVADDRIRFITETAVGDFVACGDTDSYGPVGSNAWVLRMDLVGNLIWQQAYSGPGTDWADAVLSTSDGGLGLLGSTDSYGAGLDDFWAMKLNSDGSISWQRTYGGSGRDRLLSGVWPASGPVMVGYTESFGTGSAEAFAIRECRNGGGGRIHRAALPLQNGAPRLQVKADQDLDGVFACGWRGDGLTHACLEVEQGQVPRSHHRHDRRGGRTGREQQLGRLSIAAVTGTPRIRLRMRECPAGPEIQRRAAPEPIAS